MPSPSLRHSLQRLWSTDTLAYSLRVFIALAGAMLVGLLEGRLDLVIPLFLGVIASALAETDDNWLGRLQAVAVTLLCFAVAAFSVQLLFLHPWLFVSGLAVATFALTMLGAVGPRYATLGWATLILAIYTMIGVEQRGGVPGSFWHEPLLLLAGAAWYGALSVLWAALFVHQPVQPTGFDQAARERHDEGATAMRVHVRRHLPQPGDEAHVVVGRLALRPHDLRRRDLRRGRGVVHRQKYTERPCAPAACAPAPRDRS